ncbi:MULTISPECIES: hypothetical protein [unclassified Lactococcus]|uniref:hypothetical protein n=1 Tax=unclassified Lactococcus TaxID=2643510 RepID=UPI0011C74B0A|nr:MULTISPECIES: hypothetical protein [unclassified Lactococcus]MQW23395.1 hypothetical protein [Lactococcus sp. dk101]TXK37906.1 hypothetical protein FVP42_06885 [Lactococcus sp. dk310]TXK49560.1 hypothetical protein FVP43_06855 [Lactococcus sp. dk322]
MDQKIILSAQEKMLKANLVQFLEELTFEATKLFKHPHQSISSILDLKFGYGNSLILLENYSAPTLIIQYDFSSTPTYQIALEQMLLNQLRSIESISLIPAKEGTFYDLLISSNRDDIREKITYLSEATPAHDVVKIKDKIDTLKRQKSNI